VRGAFVRSVVEIAAADRRVVLLTGDLGYMALEPFIERFPDRFFNMGVAEQNMVGVATGLAEAGFIPFVYSISPFAVLRPYEFIRNGPIAHRLPVRIVGMGGGFEYGPQGGSHHALEDLGVTRVHPGLTVIAPADHRQAATALHATWDLAGPVYYRLGKDDHTIVPGLEGRYALNGAQSLRTGSDVLLVTAGSVAVEAAAAVDALVAHGVDAALLVVATLQPPPINDLTAALRCAPVCLTVEAHYINGGLGSLVAEVIAEQHLPCRLLRCGVRKAPDGIAGSQSWQYRTHGLSREALTSAALDALGRPA
jgi:transketolase